MRINVEDAQSPVEAALLRDQRRARRRVVAAEDNRQRARRRLFDLPGDTIDIHTHVAVDQRQITVVLDGDRVEQLGVLAHRREDGRELS